MGKQIGSDSPNGAVTFRERVYKPSNGGKGSAPRINIHSKQYADNWDAIFKKSKGDKDANKEKS